MILLIDNYDSFTYNLTDYLEQLGETCQVFKNDEINVDALSSIEFDKVLISPGPNTPMESGNLMSIIETVIYKYPVLGVCLGHQAIGQYFGAKLIHAHKPMHGKVSNINHSGKGIYAGMPSIMNVCRYHSLILTDIDTEILEIDAVSNENECMGFKHKNLPVYGMQYHPEAILTQNGIKLLENWLIDIKSSVA
jgi:para-aminobenzoate synthetase component II